MQLIKVLIVDARKLGELVDKHTDAANAHIRRGEVEAAKYHINLATMYLVMSQAMTKRAAVSQAISEIPHINN